MSVTIGDVTLSEDELQDGFSAETIFSTPGSRGKIEVSAEVPVAVIGAAVVVAPAAAPGALLVFSADLAVFVIVVVAVAVVDGVAVGIATWVRADLFANMRNAGVASYALVSSQFLV